MLVYVLAGVAGLAASGPLEALGAIVEPGCAFQHLGIRTGFQGQPTGDLHHSQGVFEPVVEDGLLVTFYVMADAPELQGISGRAGSDR